MILVDTSIWIDYLNGNETPHTDYLDEALIEGRVVLGDCIFLEILQGIKNDNDYRKTKTKLTSLEQYEMLGINMVVKCANNYRALRKKGITIRKTTDVIIATFCIENHLPLLFTDQDFYPFIEHRGLIEALPIQ